MHSSARATAEALVEALPHVQRWAGRTVVVKYGGSAMVSPELADAVMQDVVLLSAVGVRVVLVHGGGNAVSELSKRLGLSATFIDGLRVTDDETMRIAQLVQVGGISRDIVAAIGRRGGRARAEQPAEHAAEVDLDLHRGRGDRLAVGAGLRHGGSRCGRLDPLNGRALGRWGRGTRAAGRPLVSAWGAGVRRLTA